METRYPKSQQANRFIAGYQISLVNGLRGKYDYLISAGSSSPGFSIVKDKNIVATGLLHNLSLIFLRRLFSDSVRLNPFINAGFGLQFYHNKLSASLIAGSGIKFRVAKNIFLFNQASYNFNASTYNSFQYNFGILGTIKRRPPKKAITTISLQQYINTDSDGDGILDQLDSCPTIKGNIAFHGCPDSDGDGIPDKLDSCKATPGFIEFKGCPIPADSLIRTSSIAPRKTSNQLIDSLENRLNALGKKIHFETNKSTIEDSSLHILSEIAAIMKENSVYDLLVNGHTDNTGSDPYNQNLSNQRAETVKSQLVIFGISASRIQTIGWGATQPIADNDTETGKKNNRRTEFKILIKK